MAIRCMGRLLPNLLRRRRRRGMARAKALAQKVVEGPHRLVLQRWLRGGRSSSSCSSCHWCKLQPYSCCFGDQCGMLQLLVMRLLMMLLILQLQLLLLNSQKVLLLLQLLGVQKVPVHLHRMLAPLFNAHPPLLMLACLFLGLGLGSRSGTLCPGDTLGRVPPITGHRLRPSRFGAQALPGPPRLEPKWLRTL